MSDAWEIHLTIAIDFASSKDAEEERLMHSSSSNINFTSYSDANDIIDKLLKSLHSRYQEILETSMRENEFLFDSVQLIYYKSYKESFVRGGSYIDSPDWTKKKKATINPKNTDSQCSKYTATVELNYEETESRPERVSSIKPFKMNIIGKELIIHQK